MAGAKRGCLFVVTLVVVLAAVVAGAGAWFFYQQTRFADTRITPPPRAWSSPVATA